MKIKVLGKEWGFCETVPTDFLKELESLLGNEIKNNLNVQII